MLLQLFPYPQTPAQSVKPAPRSLKITRPPPGNTSISPERTLEVDGDGADKREVPFDSDNGVSEVPVADVTDNIYPARRADDHKGRVGPGSTRGGGIRQRDGEVLDLSWDHVGFRVQTLKRGGGTSVGLNAR